MSDSQSTQEYEPALIDAVKKQIEYYFSKENLQTDVYLQSQMDAQMSVSLSVVMKFAKLKALTTDETLVRRALNDSTIVSVVDNRLKANIKSSGRSTIILREIPSDAPEGEVKEIFNYEGCKNILSIRSDIGDTWFVVMETEEDAKDTALDLRLKRRTFRGQAVKARIKTENVVRSYYPVAPVVAPVQPVFPILPYPPVAPIGIDMVPYGFMPPVAPVSGGASSAAVSVVANNSSTNEVTVDALESSNEETTTKSEEVAESSNKSAGAAAARPRDARKPVRPAGREPEGRRKPEPRKSTSTGAPVQPSKEREKKVDPVVSKPPIEINSMTFPPLNTVDETPVPTPGYKTEYIKYTFDGIIAIVKEVKEANLPSDLQAGDHPLAMTATPNLDLLKRQRTFSIDETREQLRQGRPVQREAIISGAVDYRSLMYGDDSHGENAHKHAKAKSVEVPSSSGNTVNAPVVAEVAKAVEESLQITEPKLSKSDADATPSPSSPQKISAATWAAMVKSSAAATADTTAVQSPVVKTFPVMKTSSAADSAKKQVKPTTEKNQATGNPRKSTEGSKEKAADKEKKNSRGEKRKPRDGEEKKAISEEPKSVTEEAESNTEGGQVGAPSAWGGKASFANIVKSKLAEEGIVEEAPKPVARKPVAPTDSSAQKPLKQNERANGIRDSGNGRDRDRNRDRNHRDKEPRERESREKDHSKKTVEETSNEIVQSEEK